MDKSAIFIKAHQLAKKALVKIGSYRMAISWALKTVWKNEKWVEDDEVSTLNQTEKAVLIHIPFGGDIWAPKSAVKMVNGFVVAYKVWINKKAFKNF